MEQFTQAFDKIVSMLQTSRYLMGNSITEADVRLFVTLVRIDEVYAVLFKANTRLVGDAPTLMQYCRDIYQFRHEQDPQQQHNNTSSNGHFKGATNASASSPTVGGGLLWDDTTPTLDADSSFSVIGREVIKLDHIKQHYYTSHAAFNNSGIIAQGRNFQQALAGPHDRWKMGHPLELALRMFN